MVRKVWEEPIPFAPELLQLNPRRLAPRIFFRLYTSLEVVSRLQVGGART
jgi:hypothetical protein